MSISSNAIVHLPFPHFFFCLRHLQRSMIWLRQMAQLSTTMSIESKKKKEKEKKELVKLWRRNSILFFHLQQELILVAKNNGRKANDGRSVTNVPQAQRATAFHYKGNQATMRGQGKEEKNGISMHVLVQ